MPYYRRRRRRFYRRKKRFYRKRRRRYARPRSIAMRSQNVPDRVKVRLNYHESFTFSGTSTKNLYQFIGNNPRDPNLTAAGHQPRGFDQWAVLYDRYYVWASSISIKMINRTVNDNDVMVCVVPTTEAGFTSIISSRDASELPYAKYRTIPGASQIATNFKLHTKMTTRKMRGEKFNNTLTAAVTADPGHQWYWNIVGENIVLASNGMSIAMAVDINYHIIFYKRALLAAS